MNKNALLLLPGLLFGVGLVVSGMNDPAKVHGFLDVAGGSWDPSLALVMVGAIVTFAAFNLLVHRRDASVFGAKLPGRRSDTKPSPRLIAGAAIFGAGWGLSGLCPGPAVTNLSTGRSEIVVYLLAMLAGMILAQRVLGADAPRSAAAAAATAGQHERGLGSLSFGTNAKNAESALRSSR